MLARGEHLRALRARGGIEVGTPEGSFVAPVSASDDAAALVGAELAIVAVKTYSLDEITPAARLLAEAGADVLPLLNGVEAADRLAAGGVPREKILGGLAEVSAARAGPGRVVRKSAFQRVALGELAGGVSPRAERIAAVLREGGIDARVSSDIAADLWRKLAFISAMAAACGLSRAPIGRVREAPLGHLLLERAVKEALSVALARGVPLELDADAAKILAFVDALAAPLEPSLLLDLRAGGPTELDDLCGAVSRLGRLAGVETPVQDTATAALGAATSGPSA